MSNERSAGRPARSETKQSAGIEDEAKLSETDDFRCLTPAQQELVRKIASRLGILLARGDHEKAMSEQVQKPISRSED